MMCDVNDLVKTPSVTLHGATYEMQNTMELRHSNLIAATHEASSTMRAATRVTFQLVCNTRGQKRTTTKDILSKEI